MHKLCPDACSSHKYKLQGPHFRTGNSGICSTKTTQIVSVPIHIFKVSYILTNLPHTSLSIANCNVTTATAAATIRGVAVQHTDVDTECETHACFTCKHKGRKINVPQHPLRRTTHYQDTRRQNWPYFLIPIFCKQPSRDIHRITTPVRARSIQKVRLPCVFRIAYGHHDTQRNRMLGREIGRCYRTQTMTLYTKHD